MRTTTSANKTLDSVNSLKLLASETRFNIMMLLFNAGEKICVKDIADRIGMTHSATSHQLAKLEERGLLKSEREGQTICYEVKDCSEAEKLLSIIKTLS